MYKLIAIDMDGTLLKNDHSVSDRNVAAIVAAKKSGVNIVITSGRPYLGIAQYLDQLQLNTEKDYIISYNGAIVENAKSRELICLASLAGKDYKKLHFAGMDLGAQPYCFTRNGCIAADKFEAAVVEARVNGIELELAEVSEIDDEIPVIKVIFSQLPEKVDQLVPNIPPEFLEEYSTTRSSPWLFEFMKKGTSKARGVELLAKHLGIERNEIMTIGDSGNDVEMLRFAGLGVAMGNGTDEAKAAANVTTLSNMDDGVAAAIDKYVLNGSD